MSTLAKLLSSRVKAEVFRLLFGLTAHELHVRELERRSGLSVSTVRQELQRLLGLGLLEVRKDGNRTYYRANIRHPLYVDIRSMVLKTSGLVEVLRECLADMDIQIAFIFGSLADNVEQAESDVDLMIIGEVGLREVASRLPVAASHLHREINPYIMTPSEFVERRSSQEHFVSSVLKSPRLLVYGDEHDLDSMGQ
jgi:DNA-binding transcriptional ArsR family regulator